jgi:hypothetical protein
LQNNMRSLNVTAYLSPVSLNTKMIKSNRMRWARRIVGTEIMGYAYNIFVGRLDGKGLFASRRIWKNTKMFQK